MSILIAFACRMHAVHLHAEYMSVACVVCYVLQRLPILVVWKTFNICSVSIHTIKYFDFLLPYVVHSNPDMT